MSEEILDDIFDFDEDLENVLPDDQVVRLSAPNGAVYRVPVEEPTSIKDILENQQLSISPSAQFIVDGTYVAIDHQVAAGGLVVVTVPLKAGC